MVAMNDEHGHGDGERCPGCRFKAELAEHLEWAADQAEQDWHAITGEFTTLMAGTLAALARLRTQRFKHHADDGEQLHVEAAAGIARLGGAIDELWHALMDDEHDDLGDDAGTGE